MTTKNIHEARLDSVKELSKTSAEFVIKPLYPGYGNTLGNSCWLSATAFVSSFALVKLLGE